MGFWSSLHRFKTDWRLLVPLLLVNLAGMVFGWYYYYDVGQFDPASQYFEPIWSWPLVADSPNAVALFFIAALAYKLTGWRSKWLEAFAFTLNVYVGLWTTFLFLAYADTMGTFEWSRVPDGHANPVLFVAHMGMPLQALVLMQDLRRDQWRLPALALVLAGLATYIFVDYWGPIWHPAPFLHPDDRTLHAGAPALMVLAAVAWLVAVLWKPEAKRPTG